MLVVALYVIAGLVTSAIAGYVTIGSIVFKAPTFLMRFLLLGFCGALIYVSVRNGRVGYALFMVGMLFIGNLLTSRPINIGTAVDSLIRALPVGAAFLGSAYIFRAMRRVFIGKFLAMAVLVGIAHAVIAAILLPRFGQQFDIGVVLDQGLAGLRMGALVGFGLEVVDFIESKLPGAEAEEES
jgi:hypothetical protein